MSAKIQVRRDTAANWTSANPTLLRGEIAFEYDTYKVKIGNGTLAWNNLPYALVSQSDAQDLIDAHADRTDNPHSVTKAQVGLGNVDNTSDANKPISTATQTALNSKADASSVYTKIESDTNFEPKNANIQSHISSTSNPHSVTKVQVGLANVDNTSDADKPISTATQSALNLKASISYVDSGLSGKADLDGSGKVPVSQLPNTVMEYKGAYNPATNIPSLSDGTGNAGDVYRISAAGSRDFGSGLITFFVGDFIIYSGSVWERSPLADGVVSVNGYQGAVVLTKSDVSLGNVPNVDATDRANHTGTQLAATISDFSSAADVRVIAGIVTHTADSDPHPQYETSSEVQTKVDAHANRTDNPHGVTKAQVGLENVPNVDATNRSNHIGTQLAETISDFISAVQAVTIDAAKIDGGVVSNTEFAYLDGVTSPIQTQINNKQETITGAATTVTTSDLTASRALASNGSGKIAVSTVTSTELGYVSGVTSAIQTQINDKRGFLGIKTLTTGTIYTPTAGTTYIEAILVGAGGGGGGVSGANTNIGAGAGGGSGAILIVSTALIGAASYTYAIGTAGTAGTGATTPTAGGAGGSTTLTIGATTYTAAGGSGGAAHTAGTAFGLTLGGAGGTLPTGGSVNVPGISGSNGFRSSGTVGFSGAGASSQYGAGGASPTAAAAGNSGTGYGAGGSGGFSTANANRAGGAGSAGVIIIREYK